MIHEIRHKSQAEFKAARPKFLNASEFGALLGLSDYQTPLSIYLAKIGEPITEFTGNRLTNEGYIQEPIIAGHYCYWDHLDMTYESCQSNILSGIPPLNKIEKCSSSFWNDKWPWLSCSPDYRIHANGLGRTGWLEVKNTTTMATNKYKDGLDPCHYIQLMAQLMITEEPYGEIVQKLDGNDMKVFCFEEHKAIHEAMIEKSREFWLKVEKARAIKKEFGITSYYGLNIDYMTSEMQDAVFLLQQEEPDFAGTEREFAFLKENIKEKPEGLTLPGNDDIKLLLEKYLAAGQTLSEAEEEVTRFKEEILVHFADATKYEWENKRYATYKSDSRGARKLHISAELKRELTL